ncbi:hypothetical protein [Sphingomicrobium marinum]|uniref:hypothetical protein n=1 Tax=Sphingomicrobium marinum TaxID=1227950 RepID=UPI0022407B9D|nr:hypothetical protein [Sphingomicrobium marinum]
MNTGNLTAEQAVEHGHQFTMANFEMARRRDWTQGDLLAVTTTMFADVVGHNFGKVGGINYLRDLADELERGEFGNNPIQIEPKPDA